MSSAVNQESRVSTRAVVAFAALIAVTALELAVAVGMAGPRTAAPTAALTLLLTGKVAIVLIALMGWRLRRRTATLTVAGIAVAVGYAIVLMLEAAFQARRW
jgi:Na+-translocating ferredoxin:NAD+ oxidoreductase RnfA subunit